MADENDTTNTEEPPPRSCCDMLWIVTTMEGWLKLVEAIMTLLAFSILASHPFIMMDVESAEYEYLIFVATTTFVFVVLHIVLRITHLFEKLPSPLTHPLIGLVGCFLASLALLVGSAISFARGEEHGESSLKSSGICGFISTALFFCEGVYFIFLYRRLSRRGGKAEVKEEDDFVQPPEKV
ncbi:uncharacterized protein LOC114957800 isoform X2 [Acropora millepora]|uniref:uncharacterized protein LOC114957800 isoform X2 n=1 Tax=Acropora millepora TaxID=45264 RepID=UPI001CF36669|nr:uncharacterized protein LOC114957800 isoform X2 [Acropora millepora]